MTQKIKIALFLGGNSSEREVSLATGEAVYKAIKDNSKFLVKKFDPAKDLLAFEKEVAENAVDMAFLALHGTGYEDGQFQEYLESLQIKYTGANVASSAIGFDKIETKKTWHDLGLPVAKDITLIKNDQTWRVSTSKDETEYEILSNLGEVLKKVKSDLKSFSMNYPLFIKPAREGSSVGVYKVSNDEELQEKLELLTSEYERILLEEALKGVEVTVPYFYKRNLQIIEILSSKGEFYNYESKYSLGGSKHILPARISQKGVENLQDAAQKTAQKLSLTDSYFRMDAFVDGEKIFLTEINTLPGMTGTSLLPEAVAKSGLDFPEMCEMIIAKTLQK